MNNLFTPLTLRGIQLKNRILVSPMCQYSSQDGFANNWHMVHLGARAVGGAALIFTEATAVTPEGRISPQDLGIWSDEHVPFLQQLTAFITAHDAIPGIQLAHAGRKASTRRPWDGRGMVPVAEGGWQPVAPSALAFSATSAVPHELTVMEIKDIITAFKLATQRALRAGFKAIEVHSAHGYLLHEFLSPLSNQRHDEYGGSFDNRIRLLKEVVTSVRSVMPEELPVFVRISATDWVESGWSADDSVQLSKVLRDHGVDVMDVSSGGMVPDAVIPFGPGYQTPFAERIRKETGILSGAVGMISSAQQADHIIRTGQADMVLLAREMLRDPYWPLRAAARLGHTIVWPSQYRLAQPEM